MYFYLIIALQAYCLYHLYTNRNAFYWWFIILFLGPIGCAIYLLTQVYNKRDAEKITENLTHVINPSKKIKDLENRLEFSDSYQNRVNLADAYLEIKDFDKAIAQYQEALKDTSQNNSYVTKQLIEAYFNIQDFNQVVFYAETIKNHTEFKKSRTQFLYGLALERLGKLDAAEANLRTIDIRYSFYEERLILAKFLISNKKTEDAKDILNAISTESSHMTKQNQRLYRATILEVGKLLKELQ
ncbi:hypothetical protein FPF71_10810 [Algibacter amylolyticus]|uniref:Uncharacterized protein n=1 Tax=Algibacter amylolyticus TaxID=1608400 RepID=A0A5M7B788_9FLAO|nr:hypothetical protein [Algibacter amylolyticus]KAA5824097.1 hypothetical protein F2B50_10810 [Algibacter amylolyticus]MBB5269654.1 hypothetical protein [Algibacter amylolyticus]TSJ74574.1 hypothetical protein FPF71_10810 [Algibacter amylolyticus]